MAIEHTLESPLARAVRVANGQSAFGRIIGRSQSYVYKLLRSGKSLPAEHVAAAEAATGVSKYDLRPDLYSREAVTTRPAPFGDMEPVR